MSSAAAKEFANARTSAGILVAAAAFPPDNAKIQAAHKAACLHAALAMLVAAWEAYLERLVKESQKAMSDATNVKLSAALALLGGLTDKEIKKFNTPAADNARTLLIAHTGYDPINDWHWAAGGLNGIQSRERLNEILLIRHSFAHGFSIPTSISWAKNRNQPGKLKIGTLHDVERFLNHLVRQTDSGMCLHITRAFGVAKPW